MAGMFYLEFLVLCYNVALLMPMVILSQALLSYKVAFLMPVLITVYNWFDPYDLTFNTNGDILRCYYF